MRRASDFFTLIRVGNYRRLELKIFGKKLLKRARLYYKSVHQSLSWKTESFVKPKRLEQ